MLILLMRTDKPDAELELWEDDTRQDAYTWQAHRELAETVHVKIQDLLAKNYKELEDIQAVGIYKGPGSFTGLRIGLSVANALAYSLSIPIVGTTGDSWQRDAVERLLRHSNEKIVLPKYGAEVHTTLPRK